jgi:hypothetical protein
MKFALLGCDEDVLQLADAALERGDVITSTWDVPVEFEEDLQAIAPRAIRLSSWQEVLNGELADAVIVGRGADDDQRADQLRVLVQAAMPMIVVHPFHESMLVYYELDMIRQETGCILVPYVPALSHPAVTMLAAMAGALADAPLGRLEQIVLERTMAERSRRSVLGQFARDAEIIRLLAGEMTKVAAMTPLTEKADYATLGIQMSGPGGVLVRWSVGPVEDMPGGALSLIGSRGKATLGMPEGDDAWMLETRVGGQTTSQVLEAPNTAASTLEQFDQARGGAEVRPNWIDAARDLELADAIDRSVRKGRTVDLYYEEHTEQGTFKGMMAATGCGLLLFTLVLFVLITALTGFVRVPKFWPIVLLAVLAIFLLLQFLKLVYPSEGPRT